jgi:hypothetical protein
MQFWDKNFQKALFSQLLKDFRLKLQISSLNIKSTSGQKYLKIWISEAFLIYFQGKI